MYRIFQIENDAVRGVEASIDRKLGFVSREIEPGPSKPIPRGTFRTFTNPNRGRGVFGSLHSGSPEGRLDSGLYHPGKAPLVLYLNPDILLP
jgi:hypothetical protein